MSAEKLSREMLRGPGVQICRLQFSNSASLCMLAGRDICQGCSVLLIKSEFKSVAYKIRSNHILEKKIIIKWSLLSEKMPLSRTRT